MEKAKFYKVESFSVKGLFHTIRQMPDGEWKCSCPGFIFNDLGECRHILKVLTDLKGRNEK